MSFLAPSAKLPAQPKLPEESEEQKFKAAEQARRNLLSTKTQTVFAGGGGKRKLLGG